MSRSILLIAITTLITIIGWTAVEIFSTANQKQLPPEIISNASQVSFSFSTDKKFLVDNFSKNSTIRYTRDQLNGQK